MKNKTIIPIKFLDMSAGGYHLSIKATINKKDAHIIIDTGASSSIFDKNRIGKFIKDAELTEHSMSASGIGTNDMEMHFHEIKRFQLGDLLLKDFEAMIMDLSHINSAYRDMGFRLVDGVLGSDLLAVYDGIIDYKNKELTLFYY